MNNNLIISHLTLRKVIGILGISLSFIVFLGGLIFSDVILNSISAYYHSNMRDIMVGTLMISGAFLLTYKGYDLRDNIISSISGISAIGISLFPCFSINGTHGFMLLNANISMIIHIIFAAIFFITLSYMSYFLFTKSGDIMTSAKKKRNLIYKICGLTIFIFLILFILTNIFFEKELLETFYFTLIIETIMLLTFGVSWFIKGETLFTDKKSHSIE